MSKRVKGWLVTYPGEKLATWWTKDPTEYVVPESTIVRGTFTPEAPDVK